MGGVAQNGQGARDSASRSFDTTEDEADARDKNELVAGATRFNLLVLEVLRVLQGTPVREVLLITGQGPGRLPLIGEQFGLFGSIITLGCHLFKLCFFGGKFLLFLQSFYLQG